MRIGILNELLSDISFDCEMPCQNNGNPTKSEKFSVNWDVVRNMQAELCFAFSEACFVDRAEVCFGKNTRLCSVVLKDKNNTLFSYNAETGKTITENNIVLEAGSVTDGVTLCLESDFSDIEVLSVKFYGALLDEKDVFPTPEIIDFSEKTVSPNVFASFCADSTDGYGAGSILCEKFREITGVKMIKAEEGTVKLFTDSSLKNEAFTLEVNEKGAVIKAKDKRGFVMGAETFVKLCDKDGVHCAKIEDAPACAFRGVHLFLPSERQMDFAKRLVKYLISPMGYNKVIIEIAGGMRFDSHPEINEAVVHANNMHMQGKWPKFPHDGVAGGGCISKECAADFVDYIRCFGIDVVPEIQSLGHVQFMTLAHPEIAEIEEVEEKLSIDTRNEDSRPETFYKHSYCPSNPKSYEILFDLVDEIIEVFKPREYVHMGHDEVYQIGVCPVCKNKDAAKLYYDDVMKIYNYLKTKNLKMMIWSDMIQPVSAYAYATRPAIDMLPKDILMLDFIWYFHLDKDIEDNLLEKGYSVGIGNLYSSHYPRFEKRIRKTGMIGGQISAWIGTNEKSMQREGKIYDYILTAQMLWSQSYRREYTLCYDRMIKALMPYMRENLKGVKYPSLADGATFETVCESDISFPPVNFESKNLEIAVDDSYKSLVFHHTELKKLTRLPWQSHDVTGKYVLTYDDGSRDEIEITNNGNIGYWNRRQNEALKHPLYRHTGYTSTYFSDSDEYKTHDGKNVCIYKYEHILDQSKKLVKVELVQNEKYNTNIFLKKIVGVK